MIALQITYTLKSEFVEQNKKNISIFLADFKKLKDTNFFYNVYLKADGLTFVHIGMYENQAAQTKVLNLPSFLAFQQQRDENGLGVDEITMEELNFIGSSLSLLS